MRKDITSLKKCNKKGVYITVDEYFKSLDKCNCKVGFDIDDTVLFSSPGFVRGQARYGKFFSFNMDFWEIFNYKWDRESTFKNVCKEIVLGHLFRGDGIYFITARRKTKSCILPQILEGEFKKYKHDFKAKIYFTGGNTSPSKSNIIKKLGLHAYFGDSDQDIEDALAANCRPIRICRSQFSYHKPLPDNGKYGEEIILGSEE